MNRKIELIKFNNLYLNKIIQYIKNYFKEIEGLNLDTKKLEKSVKQKIRDGQNFYWIILNDENPIGFIHIYKFKKKWEIFV